MKLGNYEFECELSETPFGSLSRAVHAFTGEECAISRLGQPMEIVAVVRDWRGDQVSAEQLVERFLEGARLLHRKCVDGLVTVLNADVDGDGGPYVVHEPVSRTLAALLAERLTEDDREGTGYRGKFLSPEETLKIGVEIGTALANLHRHLAVAHRHVTAASIHLGRDRVWRLGDLGIFWGRHSRDGIVSQDQHRALHLAPETLVGEGGAGDLRSDLFSLGAVLYRCATGWHTGRGALDLARLDRALPEGPAELIATMLAPRAEERPSSAKEVVRGFRECLEQLRAQSGSARRPGPGGGFREQREEGAETVQDLPSVSPPPVAAPGQGEGAELPRELEGPVLGEARRSVARKLSSRPPKPALAGPLRPVLAMKGIPVTAVAASPQSRYLATGDSRGGIAIWEAATCWRLRYLSAGGNAVRALGFAGDGTFLVSGHADGTVACWYVARGRPLWMVREHSSGVKGIAVDPSGTLALTVEDAGTMLVWQMKNGAAMGPPEGICQGVVSAVAFCATGQTLAHAGPGRQVALWSMADASPGPSLEPPRAQVRCLALAQDRTMLVAGLEDCSAAVWCLDRDDGPEYLEGHIGPVTSVLVRSTPRQVVSASRDGTAVAWSLESPRASEVIQHGAGPVTGVADLDSGRLLVTTGPDGLIGVWRVQGARRLVSLACLDGSSWAAYTPEGFVIQEPEDPPLVLLEDQAGQQFSPGIFGGEATNPDRIREALAGGG